jgi:hypothetical protein
MLREIDRTPSVPASIEITPAEAEAGARAIVNLFDRWSLRDEEACQILGGISRSTWTRWKAGNFGRIDRDLATRLSLLLGIHKGIRYLYADKQLGYEWIRKPNSNFNGQSALDVMMGGSIFALARVRRYLDAERGGW